LFQRSAVLACVGWGALTLHLPRQWVPRRAGGVAFTAPLCVSDAPGAAACKERVSQRELAPLGDLHSTRWGALAHMTSVRRRSATYALRAYARPPTIDCYQGHPFLAELDGKAAAEAGGDGRPPAAPRPAARGPPATGAAPAAAPAGAPPKGGSAAGARTGTAAAAAPPPPATLHKATASAPQLMDLLSLDEVRGRQGLGRG